MDYQLNKNNPLFKQHVVTCGRHELIRQERFEGHPIWCGRSVISINDTTAEVEAMQDCFWGCTGVLVLQFADDDSMTNEQADAIRQFVYQHHHTNFLVHCFLGCSRSVAVAKWIAEYLRIEDPELAAVKSYNTHVYAQLKAAQARMNAANGYYHESGTSSTE